MKRNGIEISSGVGTSGHGVMLRKGQQASVDFACREFLERRGLRTDAELAQVARSRRMHNRRHGRGEQ